MKACANESKEKISQIEREGIEEEGSSVKTMITAAQIMVKKLYLRIKPASILSKLLTDYFTIAFSRQQAVHFASVAD